MNGMIFDEKTMLDGNLFKFEERLNSHMNRYLENGMLLTTYFSQVEDKTTVDRGTRDVEELIGKRSPIRYNKINNLPINGFIQADTNNNDELEIEDISVDGEAVIITRTLVPKQYDFFIINHLKMKAIFEVSSVEYDTMKVDGHYKIKYRLYSTSEETYNYLMKQTIDTFYTDLNLIGSNMNPIIKEDDYVLRIKIQKMVSVMIESYRSLFYNERHNCFIFHNGDGEDYFDMCGNEFIGKHSLMNDDNSNDVVIVQDKLYEPKLLLYYNDSIYKWIELDAPVRLLQRFYYKEEFSEKYIFSSFNMWDENVMIIQPLPVQKRCWTSEDRCYFNNKQLTAFLNKDAECANDYENLIHAFIYKQDTLSIHDVSLNIADMLLSSINIWEVYIYTPIIIYIIRKILMMD